MLVWTGYYADFNILMRTKSWNSQRWKGKVCNRSRIYLNFYKYKKISTCKCGNDWINFTNISDKKIYWFCTLGKFLKILFFPSLNLEKYTFLHSLKYWRRPWSKDYKNVCKDRNTEVLFFFKNKSKMTFLSIWLSIHFSEFMFK